MFLFKVSDSHHPSDLQHLKEQLDLHPLQVHMPAVEKGDNHGQGLRAHSQPGLPPSHGPPGGEQGPEVGAPRLKQDRVDGQVVARARDQLAVRVLGLEEHGREVGGQVDQRLGVRHPLGF